MTNAIQISGKANDGRIFVVGGANYDEFYTNLLALVGTEANVNSVIEASLPLIGAASQRVTGESATAAPSIGEARQALEEVGVVDVDPIHEAINSSSTVAELDAVYPIHKSKWTPWHTEAAKAKKAELTKGTNQ